MPYAQPADLLTVGLPSAALGTLTTAQIGAALQNASDRADACFRARWGSNAVPLLAWDTTITLAVAAIASYELMLVRGYQPTAGGDDNFRRRYDDALRYLGDVQRQQAHPNVTLAQIGAPGAAQPGVTSFSVVNLANGCTGTNRGW
jgi:phage gp36-like protein